jgi:hypothetical protein
LGIFLENKVLMKPKKITNAINTSWSPSPIFFIKKKLEGFNQFSTLENDFENQNFEMFDKVVTNFGKSDDDLIY